jgi:cardiolipin synthase
VSLRQIPNIITGVRLVLIGPILWFIAGGAYQTALALFVAAGVSDGIDGYLARRFDWRTRLGSFLDPLADKLLLIGAYTVLGMQGYLPIWLAVLVIGRDLVIMGGALAYHLLTRELYMDPSFLSKLNTFMQIALVALVMLDLALLPIAPAVVSSGVWAVAFTTLLSGMLYVAVWGRKAREEVAQHDQ